MQVRLAEDGDQNSFTEILNEIIAIGGTTAYQTPLDPSYFDQLIAPNDKAVFLHVAISKDQICGFQWIEPMKGESPLLGDIATFAKVGVSQKGIGTALFDATIKAGRAAGYQTLNATIRADNSGGLAYYEKMGFRDHSITRAAPLPDGTKVDRIHKRMSLPSSAAL